MKGRIIFNNGSPARFFPIIDRTTLKVWPTDKLGQFDFDYPGGCAISIGSYGQRSRGRAFKFINERTLKMEADLHVMDDIYVVMISESIPDKQTETALMAGYEHGPSWPYPEPMSCVEGKVPEKAVDFYPFLIHREKKTYFSGIEVQGKFSVRFYRNQPFSFIAYSNKPRGKIIIYTAVEKNLRSGHDNESTGPCRAIEIKETRELTYAELSTPSIMEQLRSGL